MKKLFSFFVVLILAVICIFFISVSAIAETDSEKELPGAEEYPYSDLLIIDSDGNVKDYIGTELADYVDKITDGCTVKFLSNMTLSRRVVLTSGVSIDVTVDLGGKTLTTVKATGDGGTNGQLDLGSYTPNEVYTGMDIVFRNGAIIHESSAPVFMTRPGMNIRFENISFKAILGGSLMDDRGAVSVYFDGCTLSTDGIIISAQLNDTLADMGVSSRNITFDNTKLSGKPTVLQDIGYYNSDTKVIENINVNFIGGSSLADATIGDKFITFKRRSGGDFYLCGDINVNFALGTTFGVINSLPTVNKTLNYDKDIDSGVKYNFNLNYCDSVSILEDGTASFKKLKSAYLEDGVLKNLGLKAGIEYDSAFILNIYFSENSPITAVYFGSEKQRFTSEEINGENYYKVAVKGIRPERAATDFNFTIEFSGIFGDETVSFTYSIIDYLDKILSSEQYSTETKEEAAIVVEYINSAYDFVIIRDGNTPLTAKPNALKDLLGKDYYRSNLK